MAKLYPITTENADVWNAFLLLYKEAFPACERRPVESIERLVREKEIFRIDAIEKDGVFAGFLTSWNLGKFVYIEHFAVVSSMRGGGTGGKILDTFIAQCGKQVVLEAEKATDETSRRRLEFYARHGFAICRQPYVQPAYTDEYEPLPMHLLAYGGELDEDEFRKVRDKIYANVYNIVSL